jgi:hypothetical protein
MREPASARTKKNVYCSIRISLRQFQENKKRPRVFLFYYQKYNLSQKGGCHVFLRQRVHVSTSGDPWDVQHSRTWTRTLGTCCTRGANVMNIFEHFRTFSNIFEHFRTFSNIFEHFRTFSPNILLYPMLWLYFYVYINCCILSQNRHVYES